MERPPTPRRNRKTIESIDSRHLETLRVFHEVARALTSNLELDPLLRSIMAKMEEFFGPEHWSLLLLDPETSELYYALTAIDDEVFTRDLRIPLGQGVAGHVAASGNALVVPDVSADPAWSRYAAANPELNLRSIACLPIRHGDRTLGVLQINNSVLDLMSTSAAAFLRVVCDYAAIALENARHVRLVQHLSITDDCTGLFNARHLYTLLEQEIARFGPQHSKGRIISIQQPHFSLLFLDLDHFKSVNDRYGHLSGSRLLAEAGNLLKRVLGPTHAAFRYGGDEFVALLRDLDKPAAAELSHNLRERLASEPFLSAEGLALTITGSFGLATFPQDGANLHDLIRSADTMMYAAKAAGRNRVVIADSNNPITGIAHTSRHH
jgi:diguanylate cyclase (GGDEF)-like protein